jgi:hypothetical protein
MKPKGSTSGEAGRSVGRPQRQGDGVAARHQKQAAEPVAAKRTTAGRPSRHLESEMEDSDDSMSEEELPPPPQPVSPPIKRGPGRPPSSGKKQQQVKHPNAAAAAAAAKPQTPSKRSRKEEAAAGDSRTRRSLGGPKAAPMPVKAAPPAPKAKQPTTAPGTTKNAQKYAVQ